MTVVQLTKQIVTRLGRVKYIILLMGIVFSAMLYFYAKNQPVVYSTMASLYPLTSSDNGKGGGLISALTGGGSDMSAGLSQEASIGLEDLANSRSTREAVVLEKLPAFNNRTIASLLIENENKHISFFGTKLAMPTSAVELKGLGVALLSKTMSAKTNKSGLFIISFSSTSPELLTPVTRTMVEKVTNFYTELKIKKAKSDFDFTDTKIDSLKREMNSYDRKAVRLSNTTMFTPKDKIEYTIPKENLINDKTLIVGIYNGASNNREEALWRLQRATPILAVLDEPEPPYGATAPSTRIYAIGGFILGCLLGIFIFLADVLYKYSKLQVNNAIFGKEEILIEEKSTIILTEPQNENTSRPI